MSTLTRPSSVTGVIGQIKRRTRVVLTRQRDPEPPQLPTVSPRFPEIEFTAYAEDCLLSGFVRLEADRLSDLLNAHDEFELVDVFAMDLATGLGHEATTILIERDELLLVHAAGPRGDSGRRVRTRQHPVALTIGPYAVRGYLHCLPGVDPIASFRRRRPMVPLTDAWVEYSINGEPQRRRVSTVVVNRTMVEWIVEVFDEVVQLPSIAVHSQLGVQAKDFTGQVRGRALE